MLDACSWLSNSAPAPAQCWLWVGIESYTAAVGRWLTLVNHQTKDVSLSKVMEARQVILLSNWLCDCTCNMYKWLAVCAYMCIIRIAIIFSGVQKVHYKKLVLIMDYFYSSVFVRESKREWDRAVQEWEGEWGRESTRSSSWGATNLHYSVQYTLKPTGNGQVVHWRLFIWISH